MPQYFLTADKPSGRTTTELVEAESAKAAIRELEDRGYGNIVLHTDDHAARISRPIKLNEALTARDVVLNRARGQFRRSLGMTVRLYASMRHLCALTIGIFLLLRFMDVPWSPFDAILGAVFFLPPLLVLRGRAKVVRYHRLLEAESWRRSEEALRLLPSLSGTLSSHTAAWHKAKALAALGRTDEAYDVFMPFVSNGVISEAQFWPLMAAVYRIAEQNDLAIAAYEKALELEPDDPAVLIGMANIMLDKRRDVGRAKDCLRRARQQPLSDVAVPLFLMAEGTIALEEGNARVAVERLSEAHTQQRRFAKGHPSSAAAADEIEGRLALAEATAGDFDSARKHFRHAEPRLKALKREKLLERCRQALV